MKTIRTGPITGMFRRFSPRPAVVAGVLVFFTWAGLTPSAKATHLIGGDLTYTRLTGNLFEVTVKLFRDCNTGQAGFDATIDIGIFERNTHAIVDSATFLLTQTYPLSLNMPGSNCSPPPDVCGEAGIYTDVITLPDNPNGYYIAWQRCCRNVGIVNMVNGLNTGMVYYAEVPDPALINDSPVFNYDPLPFVCEGALFQLDYSATDSDGDSLVYMLDVPMAGTLGHPLQSNPQPVLLNQVPGPYPPIQWTPGYGLSNVFNTIPQASIHSATGQLTAQSDQLGLFAIAFRVLEYRNGTLISLMRREIEITVVACNNLPPDLETDSLPGNLTFHIYESDSLCFQADYTDADGDSLVLTYGGDVFGGPGIMPPFATATMDSGLVTVTSDFCWKTRCGQSRAQPYHLVYTVTDNGCPLPAGTLDTLLIYVHPIPQAGPVNLQCIGLVNEHTNRLTWVDTSATAAYTGRLEVFRSYNGGPYTLIAALNDGTLNQWDDTTAVNNSTENYCYFLIAYDRCGDAGPNSDTLCSEGQGNNKLNYIEYVTVRNNSEIELKWEHFPDGPFSTFYIYRAENAPGSAYELVATLEHPTVLSWTDEHVEPGEKSYCYYMLNRDLCGSISRESNPGCSICLKGQAEPWMNELYWNGYREWNGGVQRYEVFRRLGESGVFNPLLATPDSVLTVNDQQLVGTQGRYFYFVKAYEDGGTGAVSMSNEIELYQQPYIFIPNAFTPNRDLKNDRWTGYESFVRRLSVSVFNRWGQLVYTGNGLDSGWDGTYNGQDAPEGLYVYQVTYEGFGRGDGKTVRGTISLIR